MVIQNNSTPLIVLALVVMTGCAIGGMLLGNVGPFNSETASAKMQITQTQASINSNSTQFALHSALTQQAPIAQQTQIAAEMTAGPSQQTATTVALSNILQSAYINATQTAIASYSQNNQLLAQATQTVISDALIIQMLTRNATATAIVQNQANAQNANNLRNIIVLLAVLTICAWVIGFVFSKSWDARAKEKTAHTQLLAEQRRLAALRIKIQTQKARHSPLGPVPRSLIMKTPDSGNGLPRVE